MRFLIDMPLSPMLCHWLRSRGHEACHASEVGLWNSEDVEIIKRASTEDRVVVTADLDYPRILAMTRANGPGLIPFRGGDYSEEEIETRLHSALESIPIEELRQSIVVIEKKRIRRRRLPIE